MRQNRHSDPETRRGCDHTESRSPTLFAVPRGRPSGATETQFNLPGPGRMVQSRTTAERSYDSRRRLPDQTYFCPARVLAGKATGVLASGIRSSAEAVPLVSKSDASFTLVFFGIRFGVLLASCTSIERVIFPRLRSRRRAVEKPAISGHADGFASHSVGLESAVLEDTAVRSESLSQLVGRRAESKH